MVIVKVHSINSEQQSVVSNTERTFGIAMRTRRCCTVNGLSCLGVSDMFWRLAL